MDESLFYVKQERLVYEDDDGHGMPVLVPQWAYDHEAYLIVRAVMDRTPIEDDKADTRDTTFHKGGVQDHVVGPGVFGLILCNVLQWITFLCFPWVSWSIMASRACTHGLPEPPAFMTFGYWMVVFMLVVMEIRLVMRYTVVAQIELVAPFRFLGLKLSFNQWLSMAVARSFLNHSDIASNGMFLAIMLRSVVCDPKINEIWTDTVQQSLLNYIPFFVNIPFHGLCVFVWFTMLLQPLNAIGQSFPLEQVAKSRGAIPDYKLKQPREQTYAYRTPLTDKQYHTKAVQALATAGRMATVTGHDHDLTTYVAREHDWSAPSLYYELKRTCIDFAVLFMLEGTSQANVQATALAIGKATTGSIDELVAVSIFLSLLTVSMNMIDKSLKVHSLYKSVHLAVDKKLLGSNLEVDWNKKTSQCVWFMFIPLVSIATFMNLYALAKTIAVFICSHGMWNLNGCVKF